MRFKLHNVKNNIKGKKEIFLSVLLIIACLAAILAISRITPNLSWGTRPVTETSDKTLPESPEPVQQKKQFKILHIMSYHSPWKWTDDQFQGFKDSLSGLDVQYKVFQMDTKHQSSEQWKLKVASEARELIDTWKPDLVFTSDDDAQQYIAKYYVNTDIPFVFSAVNAEPEEYGFTGSKNITGVLEQMHFVQTVRLLKRLVPTVHKIAIITDTGKIWDPIMARFKNKESKLPQDVEVTGYYVLDTFEEYKRTVKDLEGKVDAIGMLGIFEFKDENGANVPLEQVQQWTIENSRLPDFTFWKDRIDKGTLCAVTVSGLAQGQAAGKIARDILSKGYKPSDYPMKSTDKGLPVVNLARAEKLNLKLDSSVLLTVEIVKEIPR
jgi:ABC-type uncharacterized transport system substrate-binding protein